MHQLDQRLGVTMKIKKISRSAVFQAGIKVLTAAFITFILMYISSNVYQKHPFIEVEFQTKQHKELMYQIFYTTDSKKPFGFNEKQSVRKKVSAGLHTEHLILPIKNIVQLRFDFGSYPGEVNVLKIALKGKNEQVLNLKDFRFVNIESQTIQNNQLTIVSNHRDPFIIHQKPLKIEPAHPIDWCFFFGLLCIYGFVSYALISYLSSLKLFGNQTLFGVIFLCLFFGSLFIPMMNISKEKESAQENRTLAIKPKMKEIIQGKSDFGKRFENWFNDHFFGREELLSLNKKFQLMNQYIVAEKVFEGKDNWFFYRIDNSIPNFLNTSVYNEREIKKGVEYLSKFNQWAENHGKKFYFVITPEKNKIYGEYVATLNKRKPDSENRTRKFLSVLNEKTNIKNIYLYDVMMAHKKENNLLYWKNDTHWNHLGAYYGYVAIMEMIKKDFPDIETIGPFPLKEIKHESGDLTRLGHLPKDLKTVYRLPDFKNTAKCEGQLADSTQTAVCKGGKEFLKVLMFRDSFAIGLSYYFNNTFEQVKYVWHQYNLPKDVLLSDIKEADIIIVEKHERRLNGIFKTFPFPVNAE